MTQSHVLKLSVIQFDVVIAPLCKVYVMGIMSFKSRAFDWNQ